MVEALTCAMVFVHQPIMKYTMRTPSDMMKNIKAMKLPRLTMSGEVKTLITLPNKRACPGFTAAASDLLARVSKLPLRMAGPRKC